MFELYTDVFAMRVGARALGTEPFLPIEPETYADQLAQKNAILADDYRFYFQAPPGTEAAQWDAVEYVLPRLARDYPPYFALQVDGANWHWQNCLLGQSVSFRPGNADTLPLPPLDWLGRQVQDDLLLLDDKPTAGFPLVAGHLCFGNRWSLDEKMGQPFLAIHAPVPGFAEQIGRASLLLLERLKSERPVWRPNWSISVVDRLNLAPHLDPDLDEIKRAVTTENAGERCFFRVERQALARLPHTGAILFTVHTYQAPFSLLAADTTWCQRAQGILRTTPEAMLRYKGILPYAEPLCAYLAREQCTNDS